MWRAFAVLAVLSATATAEPTLDLAIDGTDVHARVEGLAKPAGAFELAITDAAIEPIRPHVVTGMTDAPIGIQLVINGQESMFGYPQNNEYDPWEDTLFPHLVLALDRLDLGGRLPEGSEAALVTYATGATIKQPWRPAYMLAGAALGPITDYRGAIGTDLVMGVEQAIMNTKQRRHLRHIVLVIGDGNDTNNELARETLPSLAQANPDITFVAVIATSPVSSDGFVIARLTNNIVTALSSAGVEAGLKRALDVALDRFEASFALSAFPHDGKVHRVALRIDGHEVVSTTLAMPDPPPPPPPSRTWRWLVVAGVLVAFSLVSLVMFRAKPR